MRSKKADYVVYCYMGLICQCSAKCWTLTPAIVLFSVACARVACNLHLAMSLVAKMRMVGLKPNVDALVMEPAPQLQRRQRRRQEAQVCLCSQHKQVQKVAGISIRALRAATHFRWQRSCVLHISHCVNAWPCYPPCSPARPVYQLSQKEQFYMAHLKGPKGKTPLLNVGCLFSWRSARGPPRSTGCGPPPPTAVLIARAKPQAIVANGLRCRATSFFVL